MSYSVPAKSIKLSIPIDLADFPISAIPLPGTPGAKNMVIELTVNTPSQTSVSATLKASGLQKLLPSFQAAPQGGFVILQGKMGPANVMVEAGCVFQPNKIVQPLQEEAGQMLQIQ